MNYLKYLLTISLYTNSLYKQLKKEHTLAYSVPLTTEPYLSQSLVEKYYDIIGIQISSWMIAAN